MMKIATFVFLGYFFNCNIKKVECGCIKPLVIEVKSFSSDGTYILNQIPLFGNYNVSLSAVEKINEYIDIQVYDNEVDKLNAKVQLLEFALRHASASTTCQPHSGDLYLSLDRKDDLIKTSKSIVNTMDILDEEYFYPLKVWTTNTKHPYIDKLYIYIHIHIQLFSFRLKIYLFLSFQEKNTLVLIFKLKGILVL